MAIAANRHEINDSTINNVATKPFTGLKDNASYNAEQPSASEPVSPTDGTAFKIPVTGYVPDAPPEPDVGPQKKDRTLKGKIKSLKDTDMLGKLQKTATKESVKFAQKKLASAGPKWSENMPDIIAQTVTRFRESGKVDLLELGKSLLKEGTRYYCMKTGRIMNRSGLDVSNSVKMGNLADLANALLDALCMAVETGELRLDDPVGLLENVSGFNKIVNNSKGKRAVDKYIGNSKVVSKLSTGIPIFALGDPTFPQAPFPIITPNEFISMIYDDKLEEALSNFQHREISKSECQAYLDKINLTVEDIGDTHPPSSSQYVNRRKLLQAKGRVLTTPYVSPERIYLKNKYSNYKDYMGRYCKELAITSDEDLIYPGMTEGERIIVRKMIEFKARIREDNDLMTRGMSTGSFDDYDFEAILPTYTPEEYIQKVEPNIKHYEMTGNDPQSYELEEHDVITTVRIPNDQAAIDLILASPEEEGMCLVNDLDVTTLIRMRYYD